VYRSLYLTPKEYAELIGVTYATVRNWIKAGKVPVIQPHGFHGRMFIAKSFRVQALTYLRDTQGVRVAPQREPL
jgi:excisionase family DNA binding protein